MKKIIFFTTSPTGGGAQKVMTILSSEFSKDGYETDLIVIEEGSDEYDIGSANIVELDANRIRYSIPELVTYLKENEPYAVYATITGPNIALLIACKFALIDTKVIVREPTMRSISANRSSSLKSALENLALKHLYQTADTVVTLSEDAKKDLTEFVVGDGSNINKIPNPVDTQRIKTEAAEPVAHDWFTERNNVVIGVGRLVPKNDFETLIIAFDKFKSTSSDKLVILGEGKEEEHLKTFVKENRIRDVGFLGYVNNPYKYMARADVLALTSKYEGMPNTVIEALACGTPVVATDSPGGTGEILNDKKYGRLADIGDTDGIAELLDEVIKATSEEFDPENGIHRYSVRRIVQEYENLLEH